MCFADIETCAPTAQNQRSCKLLARKMDFVHTENKVSNMNKTLVQIAD